MDYTVWEKKAKFKCKREHAQRLHQLIMAECQHTEKKTCKNRCKSLQTALTVVYMPTLVDAGDKVMNKTWYGLAFIDPTC